jgi:surfeit locus 1 family protein
VTLLARQRPPEGPTSVRQSRSVLALLGLCVGALILCGGFAALGTWQVHRRSWKLDLIARVDQRVHAPAVPAPDASHWADVTTANSEYRHVRASGVFLNDSETLVQATTELGAGYWVLTPLRLADGTIVLINRGFVPPERRDRAAHGASGPTSPATVTGLLRMTEPGGAFLRRNDPDANRWYSRDIQAIAAARRLSHVGPYFIDADAAGTGSPVLASAMSSGAHMPESALPVGGLTVITFHNSHLVYAITWYTLALMVAGGIWMVIREERRLRRGSTGVSQGLP